MLVDVEYADANGIIGATCDGELVPYAFLADDEEGWVEHYVEGNEGNFVFNIDLGCIETDRKYGKIEFIYCEKEDQKDELANFEA